MMDETPTFQLTCDQIVCLMDETPTFQLTCDQIVCLMDETLTFQLTCDQIVCLMDGLFIHSFIHPLIAIIVELDYNVKHPSTDPPTHIHAPFT
jgi:hypothetical protein